MSKYIIIDTKKEEKILEFGARNEDEAIQYVFNLYNPLPDYYNLYQEVIKVDKKFNFKKDYEIIYLPSEITEDGDYIFY
jgi:hypothetical protein